MKKTSVYLTEQEVSRLARLAEQEGRSQAEIIRKAIRAYSPDGDKSRNFRLVASGEGSGGSIADIPEEELLAGLGE